MIVEVFSGTTRVTACLRQIGLVNSFGADKTRVRSCMGPLIIADLTTAEGEALLWSWLENPLVVGIFLAPPCGSASRARQIPLKKKFRMRNHGPRPLRSDKFPNGIPNLRPHERNRVSQANILYFLTAKLVRWADKEGVIFIVENPQFSLFWATTFMTSVSHLCMYSICHACQYGSSRKKKTMFAFNAEEFFVLSALCPGQSKAHRHAPWGLKADNTFATSDETAYPMGLAKLIAVAFTRILVHEGIGALPETMDEIQPWSLKTLQKMQAVTGHQPKSSRLPPLVRAYKTKVKLKGTLSKLPSGPVLRRVKQDIVLVNIPRQILPKGAKLLSLDTMSSLSVMGDGLIDDGGAILDLGCNSNVDDDVIMVQTWGIPWTPDEFVQQASSAGHPSSVRSFLPEALQKCLEMYRTTNVAGRVANRAATVKFWLKRVLSLRQDEAELHTKLDTQVESVIKNKKILVWKEMLESISYPDMGVVDEFTSGAMLTGSAAPTGLWPKKFTPASVTENDVRRLAKSSRAGLSYNQVVFFEEEIAQSVWQQTLDEVNRGDVEGPFELEHIPEDYPLSRRFGVRQSGKIRCVDDFSASSVNAACQTSESPKPHTLDVLAGMLVGVMDSTSSSSKWLVRAFDLKSAYRQCAVDPISEPFSYIVVGDPNTHSLKAFKMRALPFGSVKSVHAFLRVSFSIWTILVSMFDVLVTNYYDDFVAVADESESGSVDFTVKAVFRMLGWIFAEDGPKAPPFAPAVTALGVRIDVSKMHEGIVLVDNTDARRIELSEFIQGAVAKGNLPRHDALRLRGRMQFASGQLFGRIAKRCLSVVTQHAYAAPTSSLSTESVNALERFVSSLNANVPRILSKRCDVTLHVFSDACHEPEAQQPLSGMGAVLVNDAGQKLRFFSIDVDEFTLKKINASGRKTVIFELEFFAIFCSMCLWKDFLKGCNVVFHTDNDGVRDCLISCNSSSSNALPILEGCLKMEQELMFNPWYTRVPTESNVSDDPSRLQCSDLVNLGCIQDHVDVAALWAKLS